MRLSLQTFRQSFGPRFRGPETRRHPQLGYPLFPAPRMAVLGYQVEPTPGVHCLLEWSASEVARVRPLALAASFQDLRQVAAMIRAGELALPELQYPLLVFSRPREGGLSPEQHDALWAWYGLPCFEQIRDENGLLLAHECEARDGFHLTEDGRPGLLGGRLVQTLCDCGQVTPRVRIACSQVMTARAGD